MAEIKVNKDQFDSVSPDERKRITDELRQVKALGPHDEIVGDSTVPPFDENTPMKPLWNPIKDICKAACDVAAAAGITACTNAGGPALPFCLAAVEAAREACKERC